MKSYIFGKHPHYKYVASGFLVKNRSSPTSQDLPLLSQFIIILVYIGFFSAAKRFGSSSSQRLPFSQVKFVKNSADIRRKNRPFYSYVFSDLALDCKTF